MNYKNLMLISALGLITFSSCKKDDKVINEIPDDINTVTNAVEENKAKMIGTWNITEIVNMGCNDPADNETQTFGCDTVGGLEVCITATFTFVNDGTCTFLGSTTEDGTILGEIEEGEGTWEIIDSSQMTLCLEGDCTNETYELSCNSLTTTSTDPEFGCTSTMTATKQ
jgi:hypothetical protein